MKLHHRLDGPATAPVVVLSNSLGCTLELWEPQLPRLAERFRVLRFDRRGHGRSSVPPGPYSAGELAGDVLELLDGLGIERASFCGISMGGMDGMWLALHAPERIERLVLCCTAAKFGTPELWLERAETVRRDGVEAIADGALERWFTPAFRSERAGDAARYRTMLVDTPAEGYAACCEALAGFDLRAQLGSIVAPTLVIAGADDPSTPPAEGELIAAAVPGARLVVLPQAAHLANLEQPEAFTGALLEHLAGGTAERGGGQ